MAVDWSRPLTRPIVLKNGEVLRTLGDVARLFERRFSTVIEYAPLEHALELLLRAAERGANLGAITTGLMRLLDRYGAAELQVAIREALDRGVPHPNAVRLALERRREQRGEVPPIVVDLPLTVQARDAPVQPHALETYDQLKDVADE